MAPAKARLDEQFDAERFGVWIEVLVEAGADLAAEKLSKMPIEQLIPASRITRAYSKLGRSEPSRRPTAS